MCIAFCLDDDPLAVADLVPDHLGGEAREGLDSLAHTDHVCRHAHAAILVGDERVQKILRRTEIINRRRLGLLSEKPLVPANFTNHCISLPSRSVYHTRRGEKST